MMRKHTGVLGWCLALAVSAGFAALGQWQLQRMQAKEQLLERAAHVRQTPTTLVQALAAPRALAWVSGRVRFLPQQVLLDNQLQEGRAGVRVYQLAAPEGSAATVLVDLGWLPVPATRQLPTVAALHGSQAVQGLLTAPPSAGLAVGAALASTAQPQTWLAVRLEPQALQQALHRRDISSQVLRLDPAVPIGYARDLQLLVNTLPPARHLGYAVQWFGLALAVLITAALLSWRARRRHRRGH
ncbi:SURF1 family protein [Xanthomonas campestris]|uniref:SURF1 family protein n=1 Tax=Xanthomonas campestris TaxID=339 RepID=UPI0023681C54|nr:SURF1 family protein [Xanthomonas campestris]MEB2182715.1 SURF1 family protein [Xanthomonas campestris pv. campestris]MEA9658664.1 SURF1 family protein [Xanthomonas campestris pv. raphani]MEA9755395.1 SURF1 family protein [Xanthomonas campestris pv. raphani]MEA9762911.1 SURF1 family protein [Xanthomonas campestris pv. raphani]MEA9815606.1 SURF1 family protein [Xanthomonas campestris pv. raphani]